MTRVAVIGPGAMGCLFAGRLALGGHDAQALVLWTLLGLVVWRLVHKRSFERLVGRRLRCWWVRWWVCRWRRTMTLSALSKPNSGLRDRVPKLRKVIWTLW